MGKDEIKTISERYADTIIDDRSNSLWQMVYVAYFTGFDLSNYLCALENTSHESSGLNKPAVIKSVCDSCGCEHDLKVMKLCHDCLNSYFEQTVL